MIVALYWIGLAAWGWLLYLTLRRRRWGRESHDWPTADAVIVTSKLDEISGRGGRVYKPVIRYTYTVGERRFDGRTITFRHHNFSYGTARRMIEPYRRHATVVVRYHPDRAEVAVLEPGANRGNTVMVVLAGLSLGIWALLGLAL